MTAPATCRKSRCCSSRRISDDSGRKQPRRLPRAVIHIHWVGAAPVAGRQGIGFVIYWCISAFVCEEYADSSPVRYNGSSCTGGGRSLQIQPAHAQRDAGRGIRQAGFVAAAAQQDCLWRISGREEGFALLTSCYLFVLMVYIIRMYFMPASPECVFLRYNARIIIK